MFLINILLHSQIYLTDSIVFTDCDKFSKFVDKNHSPGKFYKNLYISHSFVFKLLRFGLILYLCNMRNINIIRMCYKYCVQQCS